MNEAREVKCRKELQEGLVDWRVVVLLAQLGHGVHLEEDAKLNHLTTVLTARLEVLASEVRCVTLQRLQSQLAKVLKVYSKL